MNNLLGLSERSSVATIVGTFFFLVVMIGGFAALIVAFELNSDLLESQFKISEQETQKVQEDFTIAAAYTSSETALDRRLCVTIKNIGAVPLEIPDLFIANATDPDASVDLVEISYKDSFVPMGSQKDILESQSITVEDAIHTLDIKAVTTSGIAKTTELEVFTEDSDANDPRLNMTLWMTPVNSASGQNITLVMHVYNRANTTLLEVQPNGDPDVTPSGAVEEFELVTASPVARLDPNEDALFLWNPEITGGVGSEVTFTTEVRAKVEGCDDSSFIKTNSTAEGQFGTPALKIVPGVRSEIFAKPDSLISIPNPFGWSELGEGVFAITLKNPTDKDVAITQVSIQGIPNKGGDILFLTGSLTAVQPTTGWNLDTNVIFWEDVADPVVLTGLNVTSFIVKVKPKSLTIATPINTLVFNAYSSYGQFGKGVFMFGITETATPIVNVFMNTTHDAPGTEKFAFPGLISGSTITFNATIANTGVEQSGSEQTINTNSFLLINIPPGWTNIDNSTSGTSSGLLPGTFIEFADGSFQIPVNVTSAIFSGNTRTYTFDATAPSVTATALYTFTLVANGTASNKDGNVVVLGPIAEIGVQVCPTALTCGQ